MTTSKSSTKPSTKEIETKQIWIWFLGFVLALIPISSFALFLSSQSPHNSNQNAAVDSLSAMSQTQLEEEKLRQEILKMSAELQQQNFNQLTTFASFLTALVAVGGLSITFWTTLNENRKQREADRRQQSQDQEQRERDWQQRQATILQQASRQFTTAASNLDADSPALQINSLVTLLSLVSTLSSLYPESQPLQEQLYWFLLTNLQKKRSPEVQKFLSQALAKSIKLNITQAKQAGKTFPLNLANTYLSHIDLSNLDLSQTQLTKSTPNAPTQLDLGFAELPGANLCYSQLQRARGIQANLHKARLSHSNLSEARLHKANLENAILHNANLVAAHLKDANLKKAQLQRAKLQSAHLESADLRGARFEQAHLADTFFCKARFDNAALSSILLAYEWRKADFDDDVYETLKKMAQQNLEKRQQPAKDSSISS